MRALLIVNPNATSTTPATRDLLAHALESRVRLWVAQTKHRGHAAELAQQAVESGIDLIVVHGGDGTVNETINGILPAPGTAPAARLPLISVLPGGSANVFARSLGISPDPLHATNQLLDLIAGGEQRRIGLGHATWAATEDAESSRWFTFNAGMGMDAQVCEAIDIARAKGKAATPSRYVRTSITTYLRLKGSEPTLTVELPGPEHTFERVEGVYYAFVSNSSPWTFMGNHPVHINPGTSFDSDLGVFAMRSLGTLASLRVTRQILTVGAEPKSRKLVRLDDVPWVRLRASAPIGLQMDGDYLGLREEVTFTSVPRALDVVAPE